MLKTLLPSLCIALFIIMPGLSHAQTATDTAELLIIVSQGDLWSWSEATGLTRLTEGGDYWSFDRSPDGRTLAYATTADFVLESYERGEYYPTEIDQANILLYDLQIHEVVEIASQPSNAVYSQEEIIGYERFGPRWSPDGTQLAWIQLPLGMPDEGGWQLVIYDVAQGVAEIVVGGLPGPYGDAGMIGYIGLQWASVGLITDTFGGAGDNFFGQAIRIYDEDGTALAQHYVTSASDLRGWFWSEDEAAIIGFGSELETNRSGYFRLDPFTESGEELLSDVTAVTVSASAPDQLAYYLVNYDGVDVARWWMQEEDSPLAYSTPGGFQLYRQVAIHPDGQQIAYINDALYIWRDGETQRIPDTEQFAAAKSYAILSWGEPMGLLIQRDAVPR